MALPWECRLLLISANLYAAWYKKRFPVEFTDNMILFKHYINDIICIVYTDSLDHCEQILRNYSIPSLKLNWEVSETNAVFLDLDIWKSPSSRDQRLRYRPYRKPLNNFERLPWCTGHSLQLLRGAFKSEVHRFAVSSWSSHIYNEELVWLKDLYILHGYPLATVIQWIKGSKEIAYKNHLDWTREEDLTGSECIWPLKSSMNAVWQKLNLGMVSESMRTACTVICDEERVSVNDMARRNPGWVLKPDNYPFTHKVWKWFSWLVASMKCLMNFGNKANKHNQSLLGIQGRHAKLALAGRSFDQQEEDELLMIIPYTLEDYGFTVTCRSRADPFLHWEV